MASTIILFLCNLIVPLTMLVFGVWMRRRPPKDVNAVLGYRTRRSMKNAETWAFAHKMCGRIWTWVGLVLLIVSAGLAVLSLVRGSDALTRFTTSFTMAQVVVLLVTILPVEHALKKHFDDNGKPRK